MTQFSVTAQQAHEAAQAFRRQVAATFNEAARRDLIEGIGIRRRSATEWGLGVTLKRHPSEQELAALPPEHDGVKVKYEVVIPPPRKKY